MNAEITGWNSFDVRFPTSESLAGSDAMNPEPDYSAAYLVLRTDHPEEHEGHGLTFTIGRGNDLCVKGIEALAPKLVGRSLKEIFQNFGAVWRELTGDPQLRWLGPDKGVIHLSTAAVVNALWDLFAKVEGKPLWKLLADLSPEQLVNSLDFSGVQDLITPEEAREILAEKKQDQEQRVQELREKGYPAYTTSAGWFGYDDEKIRDLCQEAIEEGWTRIKMKVGASTPETDLRRAEMIREEIGLKRFLMMDANQVWEVEEAIQRMKELEQFDPLWIEEPIHPDDVLGHKTIAREISPISVATGEHCANRVLFKQYLRSGAMQYCQLDCCRLGGVNEAVLVLLMAEKCDVPVCPHAGGVGLCEYGQHLSMFDYVAVSGAMEDRMLEFADHLHEHFRHPVRMEEGRYLVPEAPGASVEMYPQSLKNYSFPDGDAWSE